MRSRRIVVSVAAFVVCLFPFNAVAGIVDELVVATTESSAKFKFRYRIESVEQDGVEEDALASTAKARFSWASGTVANFSVGLETDYVFKVGDQQYNSTENGRTEFPVVADPEGFDVNQAYVKYAVSNTTASFGRQRIVHGGQRFVGGVAWRQNEQTFDAFRLQIKPSESLSLDYSYVFNVNRIFGPDGGAQPSDWDSDSHLLMARFKLSEQHSIDAFAYLLDFSNDNGIPNSTATYGLEYAGNFGGLKLNASYATQSDYGDSALDYSADYYAFSAAYTLNAITLRAGYEVLGSDDGLAAFRTPLATAHKFQGWADKFLGTPASGIEDATIGVAGKLGALKLAVNYHDFSANEGSASLGSELDFVATWPVSKAVTVQLKFADYQADSHATDTRKVWATLNFAL